MAVSHKDCRPKSLVGLYGRILTSVACTHLTAFGLYSTTSVKILPYRPPARLTRAHKDRNRLPENIKAIMFKLSFPLRNEGSINQRLKGRRIFKNGLITWLLVFAFK